MPTRRQFLTGLCATPLALLVPHEVKALSLKSTKLEDFTSDAGLRQAVENLFPNVWPELSNKGTETYLGVGTIPHKSFTLATRIRTPNMKSLREAIYNDIYENKPKKVTFMRWRRYPITSYDPPMKWDGIDEQEQWKVTMRLQWW